MGEYKALFYTVEYFHIKHFDFDFNCHLIHH